MGNVFSLALLGLLSAAGGASANVSGVAVDAEGKPVTNALVVVAKSRGSTNPKTDLVRGGRLGETTTLGTARTDAAGKFDITIKSEPLTEWPPARISVWAFAEGRALDVRRLDPEAPGAMPPLRLVLDQDERVAVRLVEADGSPARGAKVSPEWVRGFLLPKELAECWRVEADEQGSVTLSGVKRADLQTVHVVSAASGVQWAALPRRKTAPLVLPLAAPGRIEGRVRFDEGEFDARAVFQLATLRDAGDGWLGGGVADATCDKEGRFQTPAIAAGPLSISVKSSSEPLCLVPNKKLQRVQPGVVNRLEAPLVRPLQIEGVVRNAEQPVLGALVLLTSPMGPATAVADEKGRFLGHALASELSVRPVRLPAPYYWPNALSVDYLVAEEEIIVELDPLQVARGASLAGQVVDADGRPVARAEVLGYWLSTDLPRDRNRRGRGLFGARQAPVARRGRLGRIGSFSRPVHAWTDESGRFTLDGLAPDAEISLWAVTGERASQATTTLQIENEAPVLVVEPEGGVSLDGRVVDPGGRTVPNATVQVTVEPVTPARYPRPLRLDCFALDAAGGCHTDAEGRFRTPRSLPGDLSYSLSVEAPGYVLAETESIEPATWQTSTFAEIVLWPELSLRTIRGRVVDRHGRAVPGARIWQSGDGPRPTEAASAADGAFTLPSVYDRPAILFTRADGFRLTGVATQNAAAVEIVLDRADAPQKQNWPAPEAWSFEKQRAWARKLVGPFLPHLEQPTGDWTQSIAKIVGRSDPKLALEIAARPATPVLTQCWLRRDAASVIIETDVDAGLQTLAQISDVQTRIQSYLDVFDGLSNEVDGRHERLLEAVQAEAHNDRTRSQIALRWFDLAELKAAAGDDEVGAANAQKRGAALSAEIQNRYENSRGLNGRSPAPAAAIAWVDGPAALAMLEGVGAPMSDWYFADVARALADRDPQLAEVALERLQYPKLRALYTQGVLQRMARADAVRAAEIARSLPTANQQAYCLALVGGAVAARDGEQARKLFDEAFAALERGPRENYAIESHNAAATAMAMLPIAERIEPGRLEEFFWRALAMRPSLPARRPLSYSEKMDIALLTQLAARYDRRLARILAEPLQWQFRKAMAPLVHGNTGAQALLAAFANVDPQWAIDLVQSLPDLEERPFKSPRRIAGLYLARSLVVSANRSRQSGSFRSLDARPSQR